MRPPDEDEPRDELTVKDETLLGDVSPDLNEPAAPVTIEEPAIGSFSTADFDAVLGSHDDLVLHVLLGDDDDDHRRRARVGRYERQDR